ncbi:unnamed protein product [Closterium sp. Naga37s-1]|nr:unnamed protein product [Closterium sp. Naga37s-1]
MIHFFQILASSLFPTPSSSRPHLPRHQLWRPQLNPSNVVRQMQEAGRADAAPVVVMALMAEREVRRALAERTAWDRRTKRAVMRMAAVARACKVREEEEGRVGRECRVSALREDSTWGGRACKAEIIRFEAIDLIRHRRGAGRQQKTGH